MKKILVLLIVAAVMALPAMANPENEPIAVAKNVKVMPVQVSGGNTANTNVAQTLANLGAQTNWAQGVAVSGNSQANSANMGYANSGAASIAGNSNDAMGDSSATSTDNIATNSQTSTATSNSGEATGFDSSVDQSNSVSQDASAPITNDQSNDQSVTIMDAQGATAESDAVQTIEDSMIKEDGWIKSVIKNIS